jgi:hypothetical protein
MSATVGQFHVYASVHLCRSGALSRSRRVGKMHALTMRVLMACDVVRLADFVDLGQRFLGSNHIRRPVLAYRTKCGRWGGG